LLGKEAGLRAVLSSHRADELRKAHGQSRDNERGEASYRHRRAHEGAEAGDGVLRGVGHGDARHPWRLCLAPMTNMTLPDRFRFLNEKTWAWSSVLLLITVFFGFRWLGLGALGVLVAVCIPFLLSTFRKPPDSKS
jgi:hypothetical protein